MIRTRAFTAAILTLATLLVTQNASAEDGLWTRPDDPKLPPDFGVQGEYVGDDEAKIGCQVIALGDGAFQMVVYPGGLPGAGWDGEKKALLDGRLGGEGSAQFRPAEGDRQYLAADPKQFCAVEKFAPRGQDEFDSAAIEGESLKLAGSDGKVYALKKTVRKSPTLGAKPPEGAIVLFDGTSTDEWTGGRLDDETKLLNTDGKDILTKRKFNNYTIHVEFLLPFKPAARGQARGNSGFYQVDLYEVQILDSFGLEGKHNECGGVYSQQPPMVNACLPPLVWQTYDVDFTNAVVKDGQKAKPAILSAKLNGIAIHDDHELADKTGGSRNDPEGTPGPIKLQGHGNPLQFRNIWIVEK
ncbi:MAG: DUF1080 domain-containing protein [Planctomycetes bacterium]|nr:DUF1080 domain-containing protein [Planctomycetota bacterium]